MNKNLAVLGGSPSFMNPLEQKNYLPDWPQFTKMIDGIFSRKYYTNHGALAQELEKRLSDLLEVNHAICMTNTGIGLMIASKALGLKGKIILPAFSHISVLQAVTWAGLEPVLCDVNQETYHLNTKSLEAQIDQNTCAILGVNLFGGSCEYEKVEEISAKFSLKSYFVSSDAIGQQYGNKKIGNFGSCEIFSLHESNIINSTDGCVITTNDDFIAARLRNMRSSYGSGPRVQIEFTGNGRMSEVQAGMALATLEKFEKRSIQNKGIFKVYDNLLSKINGIEIFKPNDIIQNRNYQKLVVRINENEFGISASKLSQVLEMENIIVTKFNLYNSNFFESMNPADIPIAFALSNSLLQLPVRGIEIPEAQMICDVIHRIHNNIDGIRIQLSD